MISESWQTLITSVYRPDHRGLETKSCYLKCVSRFLGDLQDLIAEQERRSKQFIYIYI